MEAFRRRISAEPQPFLELMRHTEAVTGIPVTAETYKRPKPTENPALAPYFAWKGGIDCTRNEEVGESLFGPQLGQRACGLIEKLIPMYDYCMPTKECASGTSGDDPCDLFRSIAFPTGEFFPPNTLRNPENYEETKAYCSCCN